MTALTIAGCVLGAVVLLAAPVGLALAIRDRRAERQPQFPPYQPAPSARRHADLRAHPQDADTVEIPTIPGGSPQ